MATGKNKKRNHSAASAQPAATQTSQNVDQPDNEDDLAEEYAYVRKDLRHLIVISVIIFAVMLGVGFLL